MLCRETVGLLVVLMMAGCQTPRSTSPTSSLPTFTNRLQDRGAANEEVEEARRMLEGQTDDVAVVIPRLVHVISKYPDSVASEEAHYWLGVAYYRVQSFRDAIDMFRQYLQLDPHGRYANASAQYVAKLTEEYEKRFLPLDELNRQIDEAQAELKAAPDNPESLRKLADLQWKRGSYDEAGETYAHLVKVQPQAATEIQLRERVEFKPDGTYVVLSPEEVRRRTVAREPLVVTDSTAFASGRDLLTREHRYYVVSGQMKNRSDSVLYGVQVHVTLYGFGGIVYDTGTRNIGSMNPGEVRAFSMQFSNFPEISDVTRYEITPTFQR